MKLLRTLSPFLVLGMAICVTVGSIYVTAQAAAQQDGTGTAEDAVASPEPAADENPFGAINEPEPAGIVPAPADAADEGAAIAEPEAVAAVPEVVLPEERDHFVRLDANGGFTGQLSSLTDPEGNMIGVSGVSVQIIRSGVVQASATTNEEGTFTVTGLTPGTSVLAAQGENELLLFGIRLAAQAGGAVPVKAEVLALELDSAVVSGLNVDAASQLMFGTAGMSAYRFDDGPGGRETSGYPAGGGGEKTTVLGHHSIQLQDDGSLVGDVYLVDPQTGARREVQDLRLYFLKNGTTVADTRVERDGRFSVGGLSTGVYAVVAKGDDGLAALSIHVIGADDVADLRQDGKYKFVTFAQQLELNVSPVNATFQGTPNDNNATPPPTLAVVPPTPAAGGAGGGAGGAGGGLGGAALAAAAGAAAGYLAADDKSPASPGK